jgi:hypothetical protein
MVHRSNKKPLKDFGTVVEQIKVSDMSLWLKSYDLGPYRYENQGLIRHEEDIFLFERTDEFKLVFIEGPEQIDDSLRQFVSLVEEFSIKMAGYDEDNGRYHYFFRKQDFDANSLPEFKKTERELDCFDYMVLLKVPVDSIDAKRYDEENYRAVALDSQWLYYEIGPSESNRKCK